MPVSSYRSICCSLAFALALVAVATTVVSAQEFTAYAGGMTSSDTKERSYAWKIEYLQGLGEHVHFTWSWLNEGHVLGHHRDGHTLQFWARGNFLDRRLSLAFGLGGYRYFDTEEAVTAQGYADVHGSGAIASASAGYYFENRMVFRGQLNRTWAPSNSIDTWTFLLGVGYQLQAPESPGPRPKPVRQVDWTTHNEVTLSLGRTVVNSYQSEKGLAGKGTYRRGVARYVVWSLALINEGDPDVIRRNGLASQVWGARVFLEEKFEIGLGVGLYFALDQKYEPLPGGAGTHTLAGLITPTFAWRFAPRWDLRVDWDRTITSYDRDTDLFTLGASYRF